MHSVVITDSDLTNNEVQAFERNKLSQLVELIEKLKFSVTPEELSGFFADECAIVSDNGSHLTYFQGTAQQAIKYYKEDLGF